MAMRLRIRTLLLSIAILSLVGWHATRVTIWYLHRAAYRSLAAYHKAQSHCSTERQDRLKEEHRRATYRLVELYKKLKLDYEAAPERFRREDFHDPRRGWEDAMRARQSEIDRLAKEAARHKWLAKWYERAYATPWCEPPPKDICQPDGSWAEKGTQGGKGDITNVDNCKTHAEPMRHLSIFVMSPFPPAVSEPANGDGGSGTFAIIQFADRTNVNTSLLPDGSHQTHTSSTGGTVDDNIPGTGSDSTTGWMLEDSDTNISSGSLNVSVFSFASDYPSLSASLGTGDTLCSEVNMSLTFTDYLVYRPSGGIWVGLAKTPSFTLSGDMTWNDATNNPSTDRNQGHWEVNSNSSAGSADGVTFRCFVSWSDYYTNHLSWTPTY